jgi:ribonuclease VapC
MVVDTSALMAILQRETAAPALIEALAGSAENLIAAATVAEALIVADRRGIGAEMARLINETGFEIVPLTAAGARDAAAAYRQWGRGQHPASLNFGDCFAYALARERDCPLLFVGDDFTQTDITPAL